MVNHVAGAASELFKINEQISSYKGKVVARCDVSHYAPALSTACAVTFSSSFFAAVSEQPNRSERADTLKRSPSRTSAAFAAIRSEKGRESNRMSTCSGSDWPSRRAVDTTISVSNLRKTGAVCTQQSQLFGRCFPEAAGDAQKFCGRSKCRAVFLRAKWR